MKKTTLVILGVSLGAVLLLLIGMMTYIIYLLSGNNTQPNFQNMSGGMMGAGMMDTEMMDEGMMHATIESEHDYLVHMIAHHEEAVASATVLKANTDRPEMKQFADTIITKRKIWYRLSGTFKEDNTKAWPVDIPPSECLRNWSITSISIKMPKNTPNTSANIARNRRAM